VFQFQNVPGTQKMNTTGTNAGGYLVSLMRKYLMPIDDVSGNFLTGLTDAGVPLDVLWAPSRSMAINRDDPATANCNTIQDVLWLPTAWEVFGSQSYSALSETAANQARLEYYDDDAKRIKYNMSGSATGWRDASPNKDYDTYFCNTTLDGVAGFGLADVASGVAPAFCVK
jgi:hypothetical protein